MSGPEDFHGFSDPIGGQCLPNAVFRVSRHNLGYGKVYPKEIAISQLPYPFRDLFLEFWLPAWVSAMSPSNEGATPDTIM